ncbi:MAG: RNA methyltransferase [Acidobacteriota bacterium]
MNPLRVVLVAPRNPLNIGAAARAMSNFGVMELRLVNPYEVAFRDARSAVNASAVLEGARQFPTVAEAIADCALVVGTTAQGPRHLEHPIRRLELGGRTIARKLASASVALLFGSEKFGLSNEDMAHCHWLTRIPTREAHGSMNLGQAVAVTLYEIMRNPTPKKAAPEAKVPARAEDIERMYQLLNEILEHCNYIHDPASEAMRLKIRRLLNRMQLNAHDATMWQGMLRKIKWKLLS